MSSTVTRVSPAAIVATVLSIVLAVGVGVLRAANAEPVERSVELAGSVAFASVFATPALLALLAIRGRTKLFVAAGILSLACAFVGLLSIGLAFVPQAVLFFVAAGRGRPSDAQGVASTAAVVLAVALGVLAFLALFRHDDPVCWARIGSTGETVRLDAERFVHGSGFGMDSSELPAGTTESGCTSDTISDSEASTAISLVAVMFVSSWLLTRRTPARPVAASAAS